MKSKIHFSKIAKFSIPTPGGLTNHKRSFDFKPGDKVLTSKEIFDIIKQIHGYGIENFEIEKSYKDPHYSIKELYKIVDTYWPFISTLNGITTLTIDENKALKKIALLIKEKFNEGFGIGVEEVKGKIQRVRSNATVIRDVNTRAQFKQLLDDILATRFKYEL